MSDPKPTSGTPAEILQGVDVRPQGDEVTARNALGVLEEAAKEPAAGKARVDIAGEMVDPVKAYGNLKEALALVKSQFGSKFKVDLKSVFFQSLPGDQVGESREGGEIIDPKMLMHPAARLAHVLAHELAHDRKLILNEALVESFVHLFFGDENPEEVYALAMEKFEEFAAKFNKNGNAEAGTKGIFELYYKRDFEGIYQGFSKNYIDKLGSEDEKDKAYELFTDVFPELDYTEDVDKPGHFDLRRMEEPEDTSTYQPVEVRARVEETEAGVKGKKPLV